MPIYTDRNKWRVRIWHKGTKLDWVVEGTKKDAEAFEARKRVEIEKAGGFPETRIAPTFSEFCVKKYNPHAETHLAKRTWTNRQYTLATLIDFFGDTKLTDISTQMGIEYQQSRATKKIRASTINDEIKVLRAILNHAVYLGVPTVRLVLKDLPVRGRKRLSFWSADQVTSLLAAVSEKSPSLYWVTLFLLETGCRKGEALALEFADLDLESGIVRIQPNEEWQPKNNESREIPLDLKGTLMTWLKQEAKKSRRFVFVSRNGNRFAYWPQRKFDLARKHAKLVGGPHTTRHTFATHFLAGLPDLYLLAKLLGHSDVKVTKLYSHLLPDHLGRARGVVAFDAPVGVAEMEAKMRWEVNP